MPLISAVTVAEWVRVLAYPKFRLSIAEQEELLADYLPSTEVVHIPEPLPAVPYCLDCNDLPFLHLAAARADALISNNHTEFKLGADRKPIMKRTTSSSRDRTTRSQSLVRTLPQLAIAVAAP